MRYLQIITTISLSILICSCGGNKFEKKQIGNNIVEAQFSEGNRINGIAKFYTLSGILEYEGNYIMGIKNGLGKTFYENGKTKDSMFYINNLIHGKAYNYDSNGVIKLIRTNYYGLEIGDHHFYSNGKINEYYFDNFEGLQLVNCSYDSIQRCESLLFNARAFVINTLVETMSAKKIFIYFPHPPNFEVTYKMVSTKEDQSNRKESIINSDRLFLDTTLNVLTSNSYYLSVDYKNKSNDSVVNVLLQKL